MTTIPLSRQISGHEGQIDKLTLRELNASDIVEMRIAPMSTKLGANDTIEIVIDYNVCMKYLVRLTGIDDIILGKLTAADFNRACNAFVGLWNSLGE